MSLLLHRHSVIKESGIVFNPVFFSAYTTANNAAGVVSSNWVSSYNPQSAFNAANGLFTAPYTGWYHLSCMVLTPGGVAGADRNVIIQLNGANVTTKSEYFVSRSASNPSSGSGRISSTIYLTAGETARLFCSHLNNNVSFSGFLFQPDTGFMGLRTSGTPSTPNAVVTSYDAVNLNIGSGFNGTTGVFTVPAGEGGAYYVFGNGYSFTTSGNLHGWRLEVNGSAYQGMNAFYNEYQGSTAGGSDPFGSVVLLNAGDTVRMYAVNRGKTLINFGAMKLSGNYFGACKPTVSSGVDPTAFTVNTQDGTDFDASTGIYTIPTDGVYLFGCCTHGVTSGGTYQEARLHVNGAFWTRGMCYQSTIYRSTVACTNIRNCVAGDEINSRFIGGAQSDQTNFFGFKLAS